MKIGINAKNLENQQSFTSFLIPIFILFCLFSYSWWFFGTETISIKINSNAQGTKFQVGKDFLEIPDTFPIKRIGLLGWDGVFPQRIRSLSWGENNQEALSSKAYNFKAYRSGISYNSGDWSTDRSGSFYFLSTPVDLERNPWVSLEFSMRSLRGIKLELYGEGKEVLSLHMRRGLINSDIFISKNEQVISSGEYYSNSVNSLISLLKPLVAGVLGGLLLWWIASCKYISLALSLPLKNIGNKTSFLLIGIFSLTTLYVAYSVLDGIPHFQDDLGYIIRAKWIFHGRLTGNIDDFNLIGEIPHIYLYEGVVKSIYTIGWPLILSIGSILNLPWLISPFLSICTSYLVFRLASNVSGRNAGIFALLFYSTSPLVLTLSSSLLAHACCGFFIVLHQFSLFYWRDNKDKLFYLMVSGLSLGFAFTIRPLTAIALTIPAIVLFLVDLISTSNKPKLIVHILIMALFGAIGSLPVWVDNYLVNLSPWIFSYEQGMGHHFGVVSWEKALALASATTSLLTTNIFGWGGGIVPAWIGGLFTYSLSLIPFFVIFQSNKSVPTVVWYSWIGLISLIGLYIGHDASGMHGFGPRFYYEAIPLMLVSSAIGASFLIDKANEQISNSKSVAAFTVVFSAMMVALPIINLPPRLESLYGYNSISANSNSNIEKDGEVLFASSWYQLASLSNYACFLNCSLENPMVTLKSWDEIQAIKQNIKK